MISGECIKGECGGPFLIGKKPMMITDSQSASGHSQKVYNYYLKGMPTNRDALVSALTDFYDRLKPRLDRFHEEHKKLDIYEATRFNTFDYIDPDENKLSDIIHDLLDPAGNHGQGVTFLAAFLETAQAPAGLIRAPFRVKREDCTLYCARFQRRIDITVDLNGFAVGIENKPWAYEGEEQL